MCDKPTKQLDWDKPLQTTEGYPAKVISRDFMRGGEVCYVVQVQSPVDHMYRGDSYLKVVNPATGVGLGINLRNKTKKVTKWYILWADGPGYRYYDTEAEAACHATDSLATLSIEIEESL